MKATAPQKIYTLSEAGRQLGINPRTMQRAYNRSSVDGMLAGGAVLVTMAQAKEIAACVPSLQVEPKQ